MLHHHSSRVHMHGGSQILVQKDIAVITLVVQNYRVLQNRR